VQCFLKMLTDWAWAHSHRYMSCAAAAGSSQVATPCLCRCWLWHWCPVSLIWLPKVQSTVLDRAAVAAPASPMSRHQSYVELVHPTQHNSCCSAHLHSPTPAVSPAPKRSSVLTTSSGRWHDPACTCTPRAVQSSTVQSSTVQSSKVQCSTSEREREMTRVPGTPRWLGGERV
jgi:hypothetical protein